MLYLLTGYKVSSSWSSKKICSKEKCFEQLLQSERPLQTALILPQWQLNWKGLATTVPDASFKFSNAITTAQFSTTITHLIQHHDQAHNQTVLHVVHGSLQCCGAHAQLLYVGSTSTLLQSTYFCYVTCMVSTFTELCSIYPEGCAIIENTLLFCFIRGPLSLRYEAHTLSVLYKGLYGIHPYSDT